jgi:glutathione synthase
MRFLFVIDPIETFNISVDSSFAVMLEAQVRGHQVLYCHISELLLEHGVPAAKARPVTLRDDAADHFTAGTAEVVRLESVDAVFMRKDPPFNMEYIFATYILEAAEPDTLIVNRAASLRSHNEKLYALQFPEFCPQSIVSAERDVIVDFQERLNDWMVVKPLDGNGGEGIFIVAPDDPNRNVIIEQSTKHGRRPVLSQRYLPEARDGDKRILIIDGKFEGAVLRVPGGTDPRGNLHVGARSVKSELSVREKELINVLGPRLRADGHIFVGIDVIGDHLTEINVTSPTGIHEVNALDGRWVQGRIIDAVERRLG